jgi:hypothetical protein
VDRRNYDHSIEILRQALAQVCLGHYEKMHALRRLAAAVE